MVEDEANEEELDELMDDIEIEEELHQEDKVRKKNAKILMISVIGLIAIAGVYFGINYYNSMATEDEINDQGAMALIDEENKEILLLQKDMKEVKEAPQPSSKKKEEKVETTGALPIEKSSKTTDKNKSPPPQVEEKKRVKSGSSKKPVKEKVAILEPLSRATEKPAVKEKTPPPVPKKTKAVKSKPAREKAAKKREKRKPEASNSTGLSELGNYYIQLGIFVMKSNAQKLTRSLKRKGFSPTNETIQNTVRMHRVYAGRFENPAEAREALSELRGTGIKASLKTISSELYTLQTGSFYMKRNAESLKDDIAELGLTSRIIQVPMLMDVQKVYVGYFKTRRGAERYRQKLEDQGFSKTMILGS